jgi:hypothetical protein
MPAITRAYIHDCPSPCQMRGQQIEELATVREPAGTFYLQQPLCIWTGLELRAVALGPTSQLPLEPPIGAAIRDRDGDVWQRRKDGWWHGVRQPEHEDWQRLQTYRPLRLLEIGDEL